MDYEYLKNNIKHEKAGEYIAYLHALESDPKTKWIQYLTKEQARALWEKAVATGLYIDGETVLLNNKGGIKILFTYNAYKNIVQIKYPETIFDFQVVYKGDEFSFKKESGKVIYRHVISNPFDSKREIIGAYGVIKNSSGEYLETINMEDIRKMKNSAGTADVWNKWEDQMVKKSIIKRICKVNFKDITKNIDKIDDENFDPEAAEIEDTVSEDIRHAQDLIELTEIYNREKETTNDLNKLVSLCADRKKELEVLPGTEQWENALSDLSNGMLEKQFMKKYFITPENFSKLCAEAI